MYRLDLQLAYQLSRIPYIIDILSWSPVNLQAEMKESHEANIVANIKYFRTVR